jgi:hypothetical protein
LGKNINVIKKNTALFDAGKEAGPEICSCLVTKLQDKIIIKDSQQILKKCGRVYLKTMVTKIASFMK